MAKSMRHSLTRLNTFLASRWQRLTKRRLYQIIGALVLVLSFLVGAAWLAVLQPELAQELGLARFGLVSESVCAGLCQGCYCDAIINGTCYVGGRPSGCIGYVGLQQQAEFARNRAQFRMEAIAHHNLYVTERGIHRCQEEE